MNFRLQRGRERKKQTRKQGETKREDKPTCDMRRGFIT
jgi:hypothetical protein